MSSDIERWEPPNDPTAFESLCLDLWKDIWQDSDAQKNGRRGQRQDGVDIFGHENGSVVSLQCKQKDGRLWAKVTPDELEAEVKAAKRFKPKLAGFILATTAARDTAVQRRANQLTEQHKKAGLFTVAVWAWEDIWHELYRRKNLFDRVAPIYWPRHAGAALTPPFNALHQLTPPVSDSTGREAKLDELRTKVKQGGMAITGEPGMGGAGKTALARRLWLTRRRLWIGFGTVCAALFFLYCWLSPGPKKAASLPNPVWQPPELPEGCKTAYLSFGDSTCQINLDEIKNGSPFVRDWGLPNDERSKSLVRSFPTVILKKNRLYVRCGAMMGGLVTLSNTLVFEKLYPKYDMNYNANAFELVNEYTIPILQVVYNRPNSITVNGIFFLTQSNAIGGIWVVFGTSHSIALITNRNDELRRTMPYKSKALFKYPSWKYPGILTDQPEPRKSGEYEPLSADDANLIIQKLRQPHPPVAVLIHAVNPDESAYKLSNQLEQIFRAGEYVPVFAPPPVSVPEIPGVSCFLYGGAGGDNTGIFEALPIILDRTGSHRGFTMMPGDRDSWYTNPVVVIMIRRK